MRAQTEDCAKGVWGSPFQHIHAATINFVTGTDALYPFVGANPPPIWPGGPAGAPRFHAVHMALIPKGPYQGMVLLWDYQEGPPVQNYQRYVVYDPNGNSPRFRNFVLRMPLGAGGVPEGDLFCVGFAWTPYGDLLVAGGTKTYSPLTAGQLVYLFDPAVPNPNYTNPQEWGDWLRQDDLQVPRWYPTVTLTHLMTNLGALPDRDCLVVSGGTSGAPHPGTTGNDYAESTYEAYFVDPRFTPNTPASATKDSRNQDPMTPPPAGWTLPQGVFFGPQHSTTQPPVPVNALGQYPRVHLLTTGKLFQSGWLRHGASVDHELFPGRWDRAVGQTGLFSGYRQSYCSNVLFPYTGSLQDYVLRAGGVFYGDPPSTPHFTVDWVDTCLATPPPPATTTSWTSLQGPNGPEYLLWSRDVANLVILADGTLLMLGGQDSGTDPPAFRTTPELYKDGVWTAVSTQASNRDYHSTALLLPDGRVLSAGGENRTWDFEVFQPHYLSCTGTRPQNVTLPDVQYDGDPRVTSWQLAFNQTFTVQCDTLPIGTHLDKIALVAPACITHHSDMHQRYVELTVVGEQQDANLLQVQAPADSKVAPRGYYMLFALTNYGVPSVAEWVRIL